MLTLSSVGFQICYNESLLDYKSNILLR